MSYNGEDKIISLGDKVLQIFVPVPRNLYGRVSSCLDLGFFVIDKDGCLFLN